MITLKLIVLVLAGGALGYMYYRFVGCSSGACPLTSNPFITVIYGMLIGFLIGWK